MQTDENRNLLITIILCIVIFFSWSYFFPSAPLPPQEATDVASSSVTGSIPLDAPQNIAATTLPREEALSQSSSRITIETPSLKGSINLVGGRLDDIMLVKYQETTDPDSPSIHLLSPAGSSSPYYADIGWGVVGSDISLPNEQTVWHTDSSSLTPQNPVLLTWNNGQGLVFERQISVDDNYVFKMTQRVRNTGTASVSLYPYALISRHGKPDTEDFFILHEGMTGYLNGSLEEVKYADLVDSPTQTFDTKGGWLGITDKYWLVALVPDQNLTAKASYRYKNQGPGIYQTDLVGTPQQIQPKDVYENTVHLFAGAKVLSMLDQYETQLGVTHFDLAVDLGWFPYITKPIFLFLTNTAKWCGNLGIAILILTLLFKLLFFPIANKQYRAMARMKDIQPKIKKLQERFSDDKMRMNQEMMELYKREKVNPVSGCLPMLLQIPVFFALYKVLFVTLEMRHAPFYGWIHDLSSPDPTNIFTLFGLIPWDPPSMMMLGLLPIIMGITMFAQQKLNPAPADPAQAKVFMILPLVFTFVLARFPAGLVIYWTWNNILTILQQYAIMRLSGTKIPKSANKK
tara:strand:+ start:971 stop:2689 length:1719 start_codon:yes stop_codon:yes gene_type:complete